MVAAEQTGQQGQQNAAGELGRGGCVRPGQCCPAFMQRSVALVADRECWYCKFADFHLHERVALDIGVCRWPHICAE